MRMRTTDLRFMTVSRRRRMESLTKIDHRDLEYVAS